MPKLRHAVAEEKYFEVKTKSHCSQHKAIFQRRQGKATKSQYFNPAMQHEYHPKLCIQN
jgi:hypothetical protein